MKKIVLNLELSDDKDKRKALKTVATLPGIDSIQMDVKKRTMIVVGTVDPVKVVSKLRKNWPTTSIVLVGPAKEPEPKKEGANKKDQEPKKEEENKGENEGSNEEAGKKKKKDDNKNNDKEEEKMKQMQIDPYVLELLRDNNNYRAYYHQSNPQLNTNYYAQSVEENPSICSIC